VRIGDKSEHERMVRSIASSVGGAMDNFDAEKAAFPRWRDIEKDQWMDNSVRNQFYLKDYTKPCWTQRGIGLTDSAKEPHILDDKTQLPPAKG
jgi:hypothetical protein